MTAGVLIYDMIFIYRDSVSTRWQWWVNSYIDGKETVIYKTRKKCTKDTKPQNKRNRKQTVKPEHKHRKKIKT